MSNQMIGLVVGGVLPALCFGLSAVFAKASNTANIALGYYMLAICAAVFIVGVLCLLFMPDRSISFAAARDAFWAGASWALGAALVAVSLAKFRAPIAQIVPLYNMNTLVGVLLGLWLFSEWQDLDVVKLMVGSVCIIIGGTLVAWA